MPRLAPSLFRRAGRISPHLATLLPACRTIDSARNELRWIREHVSSDKDKNKGEVRVARLVARRGSGEPLQYVLGSQPFADLDILCKRGVLIPRPETEAWVWRLGDLVFGAGGMGMEGEGDRGDEGGLRIVDFCSGTGCIGLSLYARGMGRRRYGKGKIPPLRVYGFDIEERAVRLARRNLRHNADRMHPNSSRHEKEEEPTKAIITFQKADIFSNEWMRHLEDDEQKERNTPKQKTKTKTKGGKIDILVSNPPYISQRGFEKDTGRSVRNHEPKIALVPSCPSPLPSTTISNHQIAPEDIFYARLLEIASDLRPRMAVFEVGDMAQAKRVVEMAIALQHSRPNANPKKQWETMEIWRDWPDNPPSTNEETTTHVNVHGKETPVSIPVRGSGHGRVVFLAEGPG